MSLINYVPSNPIFRQNNPYEKFVEQLVELESQTKLKLELQRSMQREKKTALGEVSSSVSKFISKIEELQDLRNNAFQPLSITSSDESVVRINSAASGNKEASYNVTINRLASSDTALTAIMDGEGYELSAEGDGSVTITIGEITRTITVETSYEDENGAPVTRTNREILEAFAEQINEEFGEVAQATLFTTNGSDVQLSFKSLETGFENRIQFGGDATGVLAEITDAMTHLLSENELDAEFIIDGVTFTRGSNIISDAVGGLTFTLLKATGEAETLSVKTDLAKARANINEFISAYNEVNKTIRDRTFIDAENNRRGALQDLRAVRNLTYTLRQTGMLPAEGLDEGVISSLSEIGIGFDKDGTMKITDSTLLDEALKERPQEVQQFFSHENSAVSNMRRQAEQFVDSDSGMIKSLEQGLDQRIQRLGNRIEAQERYLVRYEEQQRRIFNELQQIIIQGESQFQRVVNYRMMMLGY